MCSILLYGAQLYLLWVQAELDLTATTVTVIAGEGEDEDESFFELYSPFFYISDDVFAGVWV